MGTIGVVLLAGRIFDVSNREFRSLQSFIENGMRSGLPEPKARDGELTWC